jgi:hypothetical protein
LAIDNHTPPKDEYDSAPVVLSSGQWEGEVESVPIGDTRRARAWLVGVRDFEPPELGWYYVYITNRQAKFWSRDRVILDVEEPAVTIFPPGTDHSAELDGHAFVFGVAGPSFSEVDPGAWPKTAKVASIETVLKNMDGSHLRLVVGRKRKDEEDWEDRDWSLDERGGVLTRQVLLNASDGFELSVANENTKHAAHAHQSAFEVFASASGINVSWRGKEVESQSATGPAIVVVPPPFCHDVAPSGTTYVLRVSHDGATTVDDVTPCTSLE